jgi:hypothetical protein
MSEFQNKMEKYGYSTCGKKGKIVFWANYFYWIDRQQENEGHFVFSKELYHFMKEHDPQIDKILKDILEYAFVFVSVKGNKGEFVRDSLKRIS